MSAQGRAARAVAHRQGQCRRAAMAWRAYPLFRHARVDGDLRRARRRFRRAASSAAVAARRRPMSRRCGAVSTPIKAGPRPDLEAIVAALGPLVAPPARNRPHARAGASGMNARANRSAAGEPERLPPPEAVRQPLTARGAAGVRRRRGRRGRAARPFPRARGGRAQPRAVAHAAQGADRGRRSEHRRKRRARSGGAARRGRAHRLRGAAGGGFAARSARTCPLPSSTKTSILIVIDKPAGLVVHPAPGHAAGTLVNALIRHCGASLSGVGGVRRPGIVHRLDKDTSGLLVVAKTDAAHRGLAELFADHGRTGSLEREYLALVWGALRRRRRQNRGADRPRSAPSGKDGGRGRGARPPRRDPLAAQGGARTGDPDRLPARDRTDPPDPRPYGVDRPSAPGRFGLWRGVQDQGGAARAEAAGRARRRSGDRLCTLRSWGSNIPSPARRSASKALRPKISANLAQCTTSRARQGSARAKPRLKQCSFAHANSASKRGPFSATLARPYICPTRP